MFGAKAGELIGIAEALRDVERDVTLKIRQLMEYIGTETVAYLRSYTALMAPPIRPGDPERRRHPGYWSDRSGALAGAYDHEVSQSARGWTLTLTNSMEYAATLEARDGYYVLSGVADPGGPVEQAMRRAVAIIAPDWTVRSYD